MRAYNRLEIVYTKTPTYSTISISHRGPKIPDEHMRAAARFIIAKSTIFWSDGNDAGLDTGRNMQNFRTHFLRQNPSLNDFFAEFQDLELSDKLEPCVSYYIHFS